MSGIERRWTLQQALTRLFLELTRAHPRMEPMMAAGLEIVVGALDLPMGILEFRPRPEGPVLRIFRGLPEESAGALLAALRDLTSDRPVWVRDVEEAPPMLREALRAAGLGAAAGLPMGGGPGWAGGLILGSPKPRTWGAEEREFLEGAVQAIGLALERAALHQAAARQAEELAFLNRLALRANRAQDLYELFASVLPELVQLMGADRGAVALIASSGDHLVVVTEYNPVGTPSGLGERIPIPDNPSMAWILQERRPLAIEDVQTDPRIAPVRAMLKRVGVRSMLLVPLWIGEWIVGTLGIDYVREPHVFTPEEIRLAETAAHQLADALKRFRMIHILQAQADRLHVLYQTARALAELQDLPALLTRALEEILAHLPADGTSVYVADPADPDVLRAVVALGYSAVPMVRLSSQAAEETITAQIAIRGEPVWVEECDRYPYPPITRRILIQERIRSHAALPLRRGATLLGVLHVVWRRPRAMDPETRDLLESLADLLATGIHSARVFEALQRALAQRETLNRALEEALTAREQMIQNVSHELRTPLAVALGYLELLAEGALGPLSASQQEAVAIARERLGQLHRYIELLLTLQTVRGAPQLHRPLDLRRLVEAVARMIRARPDPEKNPFEVRLPAEAVWVVGDAEALAHAIGELLDNAFKFSPPGGRVELELASEGGIARVIIRDEGIGIPIESLSRVGEPFYQVDGGTTRRFGGMGIGLAVARSVAEAHGGRLRLHPRAPRGVEAVLEIPLSGSPEGSAA